MLAGDTRLLIVTSLYCYYQTDCRRTAAKNFWLCWAKWTCGIAIERRFVSRFYAACFIAVVSMDQSARELPDCIWRHCPMSRIVQWVITRDVTIELRVVFHLYKFLTHRCSFFLHSEVFLPSLWCTVRQNLYVSMLIVWSRCISSSPTQLSGVYFMSSWSNRRHVCSTQQSDYQSVAVAFCCRSLPIILSVH